MTWRQVWCVLTNLTPQNETGHRNKPPTPPLQCNTMQHSKKAPHNTLPPWVLMGSATHSLTLKVGESQLNWLLLGLILFFFTVNETLARRLQSNMSSERARGEKPHVRSDSTHQPTHNITKISPLWLASTRKGAKMAMLLPGWLACGQPTKTRRGRFWNNLSLSTTAPQSTVQAC